MQRVKKDLKKGLFITFEGGEGSGKTTQIRLLAAWLKKKDIPFLLTREPGGTPLADRIRSLLLDAKTKNLSPALELFLYAVARRDHVSEVILPALEDGKVVICDRFSDATLAYQGWGRGLPVKTIQKINHSATGGLKPNVTFLFDLPVQVGLGRAATRVRKLKKGTPLEDRFERESLNFHERIRRGYLTLARKGKRRFRIIDAQRSPSEIFKQLCREMETIL